MLSKNFLATLVLIVAASASPTKRGGDSCDQDQDLKCCQSTGLSPLWPGFIIGFGCTNVLSIADCNQFAGCCNQHGGLNVCVAV
ncbi:hypothetical protein EDB81DRAFT_892714 [Dactylonectria macrodidyma]|uniref:Hydrophobin n=1 Tax=Dactylonectria macrodidyma TaxID=307937 RepID=A0A9P9DAH9_9HYPO|nr:hypothetical protein EDB81DRAFT_892714 [Dactylonectria macrodidyma]